MISCLPTCLLLLLAAISSQPITANPTDKIVCYFGSWSGYRNGNGKFEPEYINPNLCTHIIYGFVGITTEGGVRILDSWNDLPDGKDFFGRFNKNREINPSLKSLVAIGGWNEGSYTYSQVMNNPSTRAAFINNVVKFVLQYEFDGFDLDWEYPAQRGGAASDMEAYVSLIQELRAEFDKHDLLLTAAVGVGTYLVGSAYDIPALSKYLHFINMMTYDLHGAWDSVTGHNSPLYAGSIDTTDAARALNVNASILNWIQNGAAPEKLVLGMGTYGRTFTLANAGSAEPGAPSTGAGAGGQYTNEAGMMGYNEICEKQKNGGWNILWDDEQKVPYTTSGNQWIGYDNVQSIKLKAEFAKKLGLGGAMIWSLETDDFLGICGTKFPLLTAINEVLFGGVSTSKPASSTSSSTGAGISSGTSTPTQPPKTTTGSSGSGSGGGVPDPSGLCTKQGYIRDPSDCTVFYNCYDVNGVLVPARFQCAAGTAFDPASSTCNFIDQVDCTN